MRLADKVALVTAAGGPMGSAVARRFATEGAKLSINDISGNRLAGRGTGNPRGRRRRGGVARRRLRVGRSEGAL